MTQLRYAPTILLERMFLMNMFSLSQLTNTSDVSRLVTFCRDGLIAIWDIPPLLPIAEVDDPPAPPGNPAQLTPAHILDSNRWNRISDEAVVESQLRFGINSPRPMTSPRSTAAGPCRVSWDVWACNHARSQPQLLLHRYELQLPPSSHALEPSNAEVVLVGKAVTDRDYYHRDRRRKVDYSSNGDGGISAISYVVGHGMALMVLEPCDGPCRIGPERDCMGEVPKENVAELKLAWLVGYMDHFVDPNILCHDATSRRIAYVPETWYDASTVPLIHVYLLRTCS